MKIGCDLCDNAEASVFCSADEAALCEDCDYRVHYANKLARKHLRFSLLHPSFKESPLCDICQEKRAILFCQEDRAILCRECDLPIHKANEHTQKHNRFLLTGVKLSASSSSYPTSSSCNDLDANVKSNSKSSQPSSNKQGSVSNEFFSSPSIDRSSSPSVGYKVDYNSTCDNASISTSGISEYLETLPGWIVDDFLDPLLPTVGFPKTLDSFLPLADQDLDSYVSCISAEPTTFCAPFPRPLHNGLLGDECRESKVAYNKNRCDDCFTVPEITPRSKNTKHCP
ncbi:hypothetical protein K2173_002268 [Erythroxylum novogranatense]|uniref:B box-type domain-containing protein n=1 Tax=Erythroxylum novogranatense TaxID=1862640 RepID=A0AAV8TAT5_9ROSI|nr:hypothetical protein K2173_002268 [Erythroxylum novogranatense]